MFQTLRIIGGEWRGRRIRFAAEGGIRPTPDRVRETLFNWLMAYVAGSRCLDLFAGSGALGLEALSRGAAHATFIERARKNVEGLREITSRLAPARSTVIEADALAWLGGTAQPFDIVFLDPPFAGGLLADAMCLLAARGWLATGAFIYLEAPAKTGPPALPTGWAMHRTGRAGAVGYHLARRQGEGTAT
ncbi:MAG TPA: 16S rRNA (guanine(966)-N(2))-methyltransferase RsmD [Steroidobacteraceae bacterium]|nr:16S rRNA (guanine(966)-N(2))-methyltransferase RsmD [Steroidobacteraceae bacterium]